VVKSAGKSLRIPVEFPETQKFAGNDYEWQNLQEKP
jgi:hypothetical protein